MPSYLISPSHISIDPLRSGWKRVYLHHPYFGLWWCFTQFNCSPLLFFAWPYLLVSFSRELIHGLLERPRTLLRRAFNTGVRTGLPNSFRWEINYLLERAHRPNVLIYFSQSAKWNTSGTKAEYPDILTIIIPFSINLVVSYFFLKMMAGHWIMFWRHTTAQSGIKVQALKRTIQFSDHIIARSHSTLRSCQLLWLGPRTCLQEANTRVSPKYLLFTQLQLPNRIQFHLLFKTHPAGRGSRKQSQSWPQFLAESVPLPLLRWPYCCWEGRNRGLEKIPLVFRAPMTGIFQSQLS